MPFPYDRYPWLNFQELNLAYFIAHFQEIFEQWTQLLADNEAWKTATEQDLEDWKADTLGALEVWKTETESSIEGWESTTLTALTAWQTAAETAFEAIRVQAAASATAAAGSATAAQAAKTAAEAAQTAAETAAASIVASAAEIDLTKNTVHGMLGECTDYGDIIDVLDAAGGSDIITLIAKVLPDRTGSGTPSSENPRPFSARTSAGIGITPKNMLRQRSGSSTTSGVTVTPNSDGTFSFSGTGAGGGPVIGYVYLKEGVKYYSEGEYDGTNYYLRLDPPSGTSSNRVFPGNGSTFTAPETGSWTVREYVKSGVSFNKSHVNILVCLANSAHTKTPSLGALRTIPFDENVTAFYAGILEYNRGAITLKAYPHYASYNGEALAGEWASSVDVYSPGGTPSTGAEVIDLSGAISETYTFTSDVLLAMFEGETVVTGNFTATVLEELTYGRNEQLAAKNHYAVPSYFRLNNYLTDKLTAIRSAILDSGGNYDSFIWITDCHWTMNAKNSPSLIKYITDRVPIPRVFFGGDMSEGINITALSAYKEAIKAKIYNTIGNHEYHNYYYDIDHPSNSLTMKGEYLWEYFNSGMLDAVIGDAERNYYYVDNPVQKMRYIILNVYDEGTVAAFETAQQDWLSNTALDLPTGYTAVVIAHQVAYPNHSTGALSFDYTVASPYIQTIVDTAAAASVKIAGIFCGHAHFDGLGRTAGGTPVIVSTCDKYKPSAGYDDWLSNTRFLHTLTEQAFDVVIIDKTNEKITAVRIGCPADNPTGSPLETRTITYGE